MSRVDSETKEKIAFIARLTELCETSRPAEVQRLLGIPYQSAKNYLTGRYPDSAVLIKIARRTGCSIDWLLTGTGKKFLDIEPNLDTPISTGQMESFVRRICVEVINERLGENEDHLKTVKLQPSEIMSEKVADNSATLTGRQR